MSSYIAKAKAMYFASVLDLVSVVCILLLGNKVVGFNMAWAEKDE